MSIDPSDLRHIYIGRRSHDFIIIGLKNDAHDIKYIFRCQCGTLLIMTLDGFLKKRLKRCKHCQTYEDQQEIDDWIQEWNEYTCDILMYHRRDQIIMRKAYRPYYYGPIAVYKLISEDEI